jgi:excisionase family DNA binding protein
MRALVEDSGRDGKVMSMNRPYSPATLAERWDCTPQAVHRLIRKGALSCFRVGALVRIPAEEVERIECATASQGPEKESSSSSGTMKKAADTEARLLRLTSGRRSTTPASS